MAGVVEYEFLNCSSMLNQANLAIMVAVVFLLQILVIMSSLHLVGQLAEWGLIVIWNIAGKTTFIDEYLKMRIIKAKVDGQSFATFQRWQKRQSDFSATECSD